jgi:hypothetical protein
MIKFWGLIGWSGRWVVGEGEYFHYLVEREGGVLFPAQSEI